MEHLFEHYQILVEKLNLPARDPIENLTICHLSGEPDYQKVLSLFLKIFPDEIDSEKASELRDLNVSEVESNFLAKINEEIIGFLISGIINKVGYISYLGIDTSHRSQGIATALLKQFKIYLEQKNVKKIRCTIRKDNKKTLGYIHFLGFRLL
jgi:ribosomal protein S18 acetylase RimI-like enzyme